MADELSKEEIERYLALKAEKQAAQQTLDVKKRALDPLENKINKYIEKNGGSDHTTTHYGFVLALVPYRRQQVGWKDEFIDVAGDKKALELQQSMPMTYTISVRPIAPASE